MKSQVTDITKTLSELTSELRSMRETIDAQCTKIACLNRNVEKLQKENHELRKRLKKYESPGKNSGNSSTPPSKEKMKDGVVRRTKSLRKKSGLSPGGQPGHEGHNKGMAAEPDAVENRMSGYCRECGRDLSDIEGELDYVSQVVDLPTLAPVITEYRHYKKVCTCGCCNKGYEPRKRGSQITFGGNIKSIVTYLNIVQCVPFGRLAALMEEVFSVHMSQGTIANFVQEAMRKSRPAIRMLEEMLKKSPIVGFDESGCYNNKKLDWAWIAQTAYLTLCFRAMGRSSKVLEERFGDALGHMVAVTDDRHSAYFVIDFLDHQECLAHLLRELEYLTELDPDQQWSRDVADLLRKAIHERNARPDEVIERKPWLDKLDRLLQANLLHLKDCFERLRKGLAKCRDYIFGFLENPAIPSDNNASERGIRKLKIKQKISGTFGLTGKTWPKEKSSCLQAVRSVFISLSLRVIFDSITLIIIETLSYMPEDIAHPPLYAYLSCKSDTCSLSGLRTFCKRHPTKHVLYIRKILPR